jgi:hypothetical protein
MRPTHAIILAGALVAVSAPSALAAWDPPARASRGPMPAASPRVAMDAGGDAAVAWVRGRGRAAQIVVSVRRADGGWSFPEGISRRGGRSLDPAVAIDASGRAIVAWRQAVRVRTVVSRGVRRRQNVYVVRVRERQIGETAWSPISTLSSDRQKTGAPSLATDDSGAAVVAWHWGTGTAPGDPGYLGEVQAAARTGTATWSGAARLSRASVCRSLRQPRVALGSSGDLVIWWGCELRRGSVTTMSVSRAAGDPMGPEAELPMRGDRGIAADLQVSADGRAVAVGADRDGTLRWWRGAVDSTLALDPLPAAGGVQRADTTAGAPRLALAASGDGITTWVDPIGRPRAAGVAGSLGVGDALTLDAPGRPASGARAASGRGRLAAVVWSAGGRAYGTTRASDGTVATRTTLSGTGIVPGSTRVAMDAAGDAVAVWTRRTGGRLVVERATASG